RPDHGAEGGEGEGAADRDPADAGGGQVGDRGRPGQGEDVDGAGDRGHQPGDVVQAARAGGVQRCGPGLLVGLEAGDGVGQVGSAVQVVLGPGGEHQVDRSPVGDLGGGPEPLGGPARGADGGGPPGGG